MTYPAISLPVERRRRRPGFKARLAIALILLALVVAPSLQLAPTVIEQGRDSGIFAYTGKVIAEGGLPYRDAWDNKPPGVYYIDALAFLLFGANRWAIWLIETITVFVTGGVLFALLGQVYGQRRMAWIGAGAFALLVRHPGLVSDTNFTEVYALLPQVICFWAGYQFLRSPRNRWAFAVGISAGLAFLTKQTTIGMAVAFIPAIVLSRHEIVHAKQRWAWLGATILGGLSSLAGVAGYLSVKGVLADAVDATFIAPMAFHNWVSREPVSFVDTIIHTLTASTAPVVIGPLLPFLLIGIVAAVRQILPRRARPRRGLTSTQTLMVWAVLTFFADLLVTNPTSRGYGHYYVTLLPSMVILIVFSVSVIVGRGTPTRLLGRVGRAALWLYLFLAVAGGAIGGTIYRLWTVDWEIAGPVRNKTLTEYVMENTTPEDTVLVWGATTAINFQSDRNSPMPYHYGYPLIVPGYTTEEEIWQIARDLEMNLPTLILDSTMIDGDRIPPLDPDRRREWWAMGGRRDVANLGPIYQLVAKYCTFVQEIEQTAIYRCQP